MKKIITGMVIGTVVGTMFGMGLEAAGLAKAVIDDGVDLNEVVWHGYEKGKHDSDVVINSWRRKYSTPERRR